MPTFDPALPPTVPDRVTVWSTRRGPILAVSAGAVLLALGVAAVVDGGLGSPQVVLLLLGLGGATVGLFDVPVRTEFDARGLVRVCPLRRHRLPWDRVVALERGRPSQLTVARNALDRREGSPARQSGGLVARGPGKRRWLLSDQLEGRDEHAELRTLVAALDATVHVRAARPHHDVPPRRRPAG